MWTVSQTPQYHRKVRCLFKSHHRSGVDTVTSMQNLRQIQSFTRIFILGRLLHYIVYTRKNDSNCRLSQMLQTRPMKFGCANSLFALSVAKVVPLGEKVACTRPTLLMGEVSLYTDLLHVYTNYANYATLFIGTELSPQIVFCRIVQCKCYSQGDWVESLKVKKN